MIEKQLESAHEKETGRLEAFSDGVFAVAITLLVFNLKVPSLSDDTSTPMKLASNLFNLWPSYLTFFISFATILIMWVNHHNMFKVIHKSDTLFMFANGFLLLFVTLEPATKDMNTEAVSAGFYHSPGWGQNYPCIQILTIEELLHNAAIKMPPQFGIFK